MAETKKRLRFNRVRAMAGYRQMLRKAADQTIKEIYDDIQSRMKTVAGKDELETMSEEESTIIKRAVRGYARAIIDSYGTGSKMDIENEFWTEYKNSSLFNPSRSGKAIVGRPKGRYTNIFGKEQTSSGKMDGMNVERYAKPIAPSRAFQLAEIWLLNGGRVEEILTQHITAWVRGMGQYFEYK